MKKRQADPWSASASVGATGQTYEIRTVEDFFGVPESRRRICLREFHAWMTTHEGVLALIHASARALNVPLDAAAIRGERGVFRWIDDGLATVTAVLNTHDAASSEDAAEQP